MVGSRCPPLGRAYPPIGEAQSEISQSLFIDTVMLGRAIWCPIDQKDIAMDLWDLNEG